MANDFDALFSGDSDDSEAKAPTPAPAGKAKAKKRGRPATGKRSDEGWINRAFYVQESTDIDLEDEINKLRREGVKMDKSDLVDACLVAWLKWRKGEQADLCLGDISPRRKGK
jgi:hypothetical protein